MHRSSTHIFTRRAFLGGLCLLATRPAFAAPVSPAGKRLAALLDSFEVEKHWIAGVAIDWESGEPSGKPVSARGKHTHCSAFVAAAAKRLGVYILRPPEHGQTLLANAQFEWLASDGAAQGWRAVADPLAAQDLANRGSLVVVAYHNHYDNMPGHIAIVRPGDADHARIASEGPQIVQAGTRNSASVSMRDGFAGHPAAWKRQEARFFAHALS